MKARIIVYDLSKLSHYQKVLFNREIYGYKDNSNNNTYHYKREGILSKIPHLRLLRGALVLKKEDIGMVEPILKRHKVKYDIYEIIIPASKLS
ncbi:MAG: hypothetical protein AB1571_04415 [Nanoarchaeota archaeon]